MNTVDITINQNDLQSVQTICSSIDDKELKNKAVANALAVKTAAKYFDNSEYQIDDETGLYSFGNLFTEADIADLYINNCYVDVRLYFSKDELGVPKSHFEHGITPAAYMFIKVSENLSSAVVAGFLTSENIDTSQDAVQGFYPVKEDSLWSIDSVEQYFKLNYDENTFSDLTLYDFADGKYDDIYKIISGLLKSKSARYKLQRILKAKTVYNMVSISSEQFEQKTEEPIVEELQQSNIDSEINEIQSPSTDDGTELSDDLESLYNALDEGNSSSENSDEVIPADDNLEQELDYRTETTPNYSDDGSVVQDDNETDGENSEQIDSLFNSEESAVVSTSSTKSGFVGAIVFLIVLVGIGGGAMWLFNHFKGSLPAQNEIVSQSEIAEDNDLSGSEDFNSEQSSTQEVAMPDETVDNKPETSNKELGNSVAIPAIEKNLDASVLVSNLKVDWEVPEGYVSNTAAKRYLVKLGKVIQLNLKTDLLLLSKPPISNRIAVEITYDKMSGRFVFANILASSGEKTVDDAITETIKSALSMSLSTNTESFAKLKGNPVLIIHL